MTITNDLGIYLGAPIIHGRIKKDHFKHVIEKVKRKLSGWKSSNLSLVGRATLVQPFTSTISNYTMQTVKLPKKVCKEIDRLNKNFLWGHTEERKKIHNVKWEKVCRQKEHGGLGLRLCEDNNTTLVSKIGWRMCIETKPLWVEVMKHKYKISKNPRFWKN